MRSDRAGTRAYASAAFSEISMLTVIVDNFLSLFI